MTNRSHDFSHSSPRTRGYFQPSHRKARRLYLFPAHAGVFPFLVHLSHPRPALPRARGGISALKSSPYTGHRSSPRTRGYFRTLWRGLAVRLLFPAHAGVFPVHCCREASQAPLPRARGGISHLIKFPDPLELSSPRTRGYFRVAGVSGR